MQICSVPCMRVCVCVCVCMYVCVCMELEIYMYVREGLAEGFLGDLIATDALVDWRTTFLDAGGAG